MVVVVVVVVVFVVVVLVADIAPPNTNSHTYIHTYTHVYQVHINAQTQRDANEEKKRRTKINEENVSHPKRQQEHRHVPLR